MDENGVVPAQIQAMTTVSLLFLAVCSLNLVGLLLGKFLSRIPEVSVRRALGASRLQVFWQHIVECEVVGVIGVIGPTRMAYERVIPIVDVTAKILGAALARR